MRRPPTEAERRAAEVRRRRAPRTPRDPSIEAERIAGREIEQWVDEGPATDSIRDEAAAAADRALHDGDGRRRDHAARIDPEVGLEIHAAVGDRRAERLLGRLGQAADALDRERFEEARRIATPVLKELPGVAAAHEIAGLAEYRLGRWKQAVTHLETARALREDISLLPVLADANRALRRWAEVDAIWDHIRAASPPHDVMVEARIVVAGSLADQGRLADAIGLLEAAATPPKRVRDHHLRLWYALADLHDRAGDPIKAAQWFRLVAQHDRDFVDVTARLRALGR